MSVARDLAQDGKQKRWRSLRARVYAVVALCAVPTIVGSVVALAALASVNSRAAALNQDSVRPMAILGDLRDMEGDMRVLVWQYLAADPADRADLAKDIADTDHQADTDIQEFLSAGTLEDGEATLMRSFASDLSVWRGVRDAQIRKIADLGDLASAYAAANDALAKADDTMAEPLDKLYATEVAFGATQARDATTAYNRARLGTTLICALGLLLAVVVALLSTRGMLGAVTRIRAVLASGDRDARVGPVKDTSEIGSVGRALDEMLETMAEQQQALDREQANREAHLRAASVRQRLAEQEVRRRAQEIIDQTGAAVLTELRDVLAHADRVRDAAREIERRAAAADEVTRSMVAKAERVDQVAGTMSASLQQVNDVTTLIAGVTEETNLLALNATIEAAHAGEAGKGFAIVAGEVKGLAGRTRSSTEEITKTVATLEQDATTMTAAIRAMSEAVTGIDEATAEVSTVATNQRASVELLDRCVHETIARIESMSQLTDRLERRRHQRVLAEGLAVFRVGGRPLTGQLLDLSRGGLLCVLEEPTGLGVGAVVDLELHLGDRRLSARGRVIRRETDESGAGEQVGLEFEGLDQGAGTSIDAYLSELLGPGEAGSAAGEPDRTAVATRG
jgi:methyl-accepting chemotaxis protein